MELSPSFYRWVVRPKWFFRNSIGHTVCKKFNLFNKHVLDFGCGVGSSCYMTNPATYLGLDTDEKRIYYAKKLYPNYTFNVFDRKRLPIKDHSIDSILIISVLHHISSQYLSRYVKEFHRVLKKDGKIIINEPCVFEQANFNNQFMHLFDKGNYIRSEYEYLTLFNNYFTTEVFDKYNQFLFYNKIFFVATPKHHNLS